VVLLSNSKRFYPEKAPLKEMIKIPFNTSNSLLLFFRSAAIEHMKCTKNLSRKQWQRLKLSNKKMNRTDC